MGRQNGVGSLQVRLDSRPPSGGFHAWRKPAPMSPAARLPPGERYLRVPAAPGKWTWRGNRAHAADAALPCRGPETVGWERLLL